jgi:hypothetical protein
VGGCSIFLIPLLIASAPFGVSCSVGVRPTGLPFWARSVSIRGSSVVRNGIKTGKNRTKTGNEIATLLKSATYDTCRISGTALNTQRQNKTRTKQYKKVGGGSAETESLAVNNFISLRVHSWQKTFQHCTKRDKMGRFSLRSIFNIDVPSTYDDSPCDRSILPACDLSLLRCPVL